MTSTPTLNAYSFTLTQNDVIQGKLNRPGTVRVDKIYTLEKSLIVKTFGRVDEVVLNNVRTILQTLTRDIQKS